MSVEKFLESLKNLIARKGEIAGMLSLDLGGGSEKLGYLAKSSDYEKICNSEKMFPVAFSSTTTFYLRTCVLLFDNDIQAAAETHRNMLQALLKTYSKEGYWLNNVVLAASADTKMLSTLADEELNRQMKMESNLEASIVILKKVFSSAVNDRGENLEFSKKWNGCPVANLILKIYFKLNKISSCKDIIQTMEKDDMPPLEGLPKSQSVTYKYYQGRLSMLSENYLKAESELDYAHQHCQEKHVANMRRILQYLIPVKIILGKFPKSALLEKYHFEEFIPLVDAVKNGNVRLFNDTIAKFESIFIRRGIYLVVEKMKIIVYRNLFKRIFNPDEGGLIYDIGDFMVGLQWLGEDIDMDEVECILVNMIFKKYIQGYISHSKKKLVTGKKAFPPITSVYKK